MATLKKNESLRKSEVTETHGSSLNKSFIRFIEASDINEILDYFQKVIEDTEIVPGYLSSVLFPLCGLLDGRTTFRYEELLGLLLAKTDRQEVIKKKESDKLLVIGAGPCGLRMAIEALLLGVNVTVIEARPYFDRNNVTKLWRFVMEDLKSLGAKKIYPQLGTGAVNHVSIRILQTILLKIALILGAKVRVAEKFIGLNEPKGIKSWSSLIERKLPNGNSEIYAEQYDMIVCASGRNVPLEGFERKRLDTKLSIAITANFTP